MDRVLVLTDNEYLFNNFTKIVENKHLQQYRFDFRFSPKNKQFLDKYRESTQFSGISVIESLEEIILQYKLLISLHCKQIFPSELVTAVRCINIHPGFNPYNRGFFPQVFSIINKKKVGVTIHEMDEELDHGPIIVREEVPIESWETSGDVYRRILRTEIRLIEENLEDMLNGTYKLTYPEEEGNINSFKDFKRLCKINPSEVATYIEVIDRLRALTHDDYRNAYFYDENGMKMFVRIHIEPSLGDD